MKNKFPFNINYIPPEDLGCSYFPLRGPYSSSSSKLLDEHMEELKDFVVVISWWGKNATTT